MPKEKCSRWWKLPNILNGDIFNPIWSWCCQRAEIGRKCDYFVWIGTDKRKESDDADENLRRGEVEVELAQLGNNGRTECGQWIPPSHISLSSKLANTLLVDICWWKCFGGICFEYLYFTSLLRNTNTHRKEKIRKYIWKVNFDSKRAVLWCVPGSAGAFSMWPPHRRHVVNMHFHLPQHSYQSPIHDM